MAMLNPQMASPHFPFSHIPSKIPLPPPTRGGGSKRSLTYQGDYQHPNCSPFRRRTFVNAADPQVTSCIRFGHRQAIHLLSTLPEHIAQGRLETLKAKSEPMRPTQHQGKSPSSRFPTQWGSSTRQETTWPSIEEAYSKGEQTEVAQSLLSTSDAK
jgi:hypothetical protein